MFRLGRSRNLNLPQGDAASSSRRHLTYQPALDGIRALAVAAVLAYHAGRPWADGGFLGVDAFFVLSGYLITSLLLVEWRGRASISLLAFWARRARRLLPALFLMLIGVAVYAVVFAQPEELGKIRGDALATIGYVANWRPVFTDQSYFDRFSMPSPLRHTWSLAIEEQYYVVWPLLLLVVFRLCRGSLRVLVMVSLTLMAASALLMGLLFKSGSDPSHVYYGTDTRAQSLLMGSVLAMLLPQLGFLRRRPAGYALQLAAILCAVFIGWTWVTTSGDSSFLYRGGFLLLALAVAVVIAASVQPKVGPLGKVLSLPPLRGLGLISYGVYLWHWPVYLVLTPDRTGWGGYELFAVRVVATLAIALASYHLIEMPIRRGAFRQWRMSWTLAPAGAACLAVAVLFVTQGASSTNQLYIDFAQSEPIWDPLRPVAGSAAVSVASPNGAVGSLQGPPRVTVVGDSVGWNVAGRLQRAQLDWKIRVLDRTGAGCGLLYSEATRFEDRWVPVPFPCFDLRMRWQSDVQEFQPDAVVVFVGAMDTFDIKAEGHVMRFGTEEWHSYAMSQLNQAIDVFSSGGAKIILVTVPYPASRGLDLYAGMDRVDTGHVDRLNDLYREIAQQRASQVFIIDLNGFMSETVGHGDVVNGMDLRSDDIHFTLEGADMIVRWLAPQILGVIPEERKSPPVAGPPPGATPPPDANPPPGASPPPNAGPPPGVMPSPGANPPPGINPAPAANPPPEASPPPSANPPSDANPPSRTNRPPR